MKKARIPDLTPAPKRGAPSPQSKPAAQQPRPPRAGGIKPQATSAKSGRRGQ